MVIYNQSVKEEFLSNFNENTQHMYKWIFQKSSILEEKFNKDLSTFDINEISILMKSLNPITKTSAQSYGRIITSYIGWKNEENYNQLSISNKWLYEFVNDEIKLYWSETEFINIENKLINAQDSVIIQLFFEGIDGYGHSEILNIKKKDVDFTNQEIRLLDDKYGERTIKVSQRLLFLIDKAFNETTYYNKNGEAIGKRAKQSLVENDYLIRTGIASAKYTGRADKHLIHRRVSSIADYFGYDNFTPNKILRSGMLKYTKDKYSNQNISNEVLIKVADKFNVNILTKTGYNFSKLRETVNIENINLLY